MAHLIGLLVCAVALAQDPAAVAGPGAASRSLTEGLALLASADPVLSTEGHAIVQANIAQAADAEKRATAVSTLLDFAAATPATAQDGEEAELQPGLEAWLNAVASAAAKAYEAAVHDAADTAARCEAVRWAGYLADAGTAERFAALLDSTTVWREALNALMALPDGAGVRLVVTRIPSETSADKQMEYVRALGQFQILGAQEALSALAKSSENRALAYAALESLARLGVPPVEVVHRPADSTPDEIARFANAGLRAAQELLDHGKAKKAEHLFRMYSDSSGMWHQIRASMIGLMASGSPEAVRTALGYLGTPRLRATAQRILAESQAPGTDDLIEKAYNVGDPALQAGLLPVFLARGGEAGRKKVEAALNGGNATTRVVAAQLLGQQPGETDLLEIATSGAPWSRKSAASTFLDNANAKLLAGDDAGAAAQFRAVLQQRLGPESERAALEGLGQCGEYADNDIVADFLNDPDTGAAAYAAKARLALKNENRDDVMPELEKIAEVSPYEEGVFAAAAGMAQLGQPSSAYAKRWGFLTDWIAMGPFPDENGSAYGTSFVTEERADAIQNATWQGQQYGWQAAPVAGLPPVVDVRALFKDTDKHAAYVFAKFNLSKPMAAELQLSIAGAFELWVNGKNVAGDPSPHVWKQDEIHVAVTLNAGTNKVLLKLIRDGENWRAAVRVADRRGKPVNLESQKPAKDGSEGVGVTVGRAATAVQKTAP